MGESIESMEARFDARVKELAEPLIIDAAMEQLMKMGEPGGELYADIEQMMMDSAVAVYAQYRPIMYHRRDSLVDTRNYAISWNFTVTKDHWRGQCSYRNIATGQEDGLLEPLILGGWSRPANYWGTGRPARPWAIGGRDLYSEVKDITLSLDLDIDLSACEAQAFSEIVVPWINGGGVN